MTVVGIHKHIYVDVFNIVYFGVLSPVNTERRKALRASKAKRVPGE